MLRKPSATLVAACCLLAGNAGANYTIDLIWADTGTATLTVLSSAPNLPGSSGACAGGFLFSGGAGRCLEVRLTATALVTAALVTLGWDAASSGLAVESTGLRSFGLFGGAFAPAAPVFPIPTGTADCLALGCDTAFGSFGGVSTGVIAAGVYTIGSINFDLKFVSPLGLHQILAFLRTGVDGVTDKKFQSAPVQVNGATINSFIPEPGTGSLLGLGVLGLCAIAGRRR